MMMNKLQKKDFIIRDLVVSVAGNNRGGTWMPGPDDETPPSPISPIASVLVNMDIIESVRAAVLESLDKTEEIEAIGQAFAAGETRGNSAIRSAIFEIGAAVVASTAYSAMVGGKVGYPNPDCGGTSLETIPPTLTPVIMTGYKVHRVTELPRLKKQLEVTTEYIENAIAAQAPRGEEVNMVRDQLAGALKSLG